MKKLVMLLTIALASVCWGQACDSTTNRDSGGKPCTNIVTLGGFTYNGTPTSLPLKSQDGVASPNSQGLYNVGYLNFGNLQTNLPVDPLFTLGFNVVNPFHYPASAMQLSQGNVLSVTIINGAVKTGTGTCTHTTYETRTIVYVFDSGSETIDPPDANGNNTYDWSGTVSVPEHFSHCISPGGRGSGTAPTYTTEDGSGELSATGSYVGPAAATTSCGQPIVADGGPLPICPPCRPGGAKCCGPHCDQCKAFRDNGSVLTEGLE